LLSDSFCIIANIGEMSRGFSGILKIFPDQIRGVVFSSSSLGVVEM